MLQLLSPKWTDIFVACKILIGKKINWIKFNYEEREKKKEILLLQFPLLVRTASAEYLPEDMEWYDMIVH